MSRAPAREAMGLAAQRNDLAAAGRRNAEVLVAMGMSGRLGKRWSKANESYLAGNQRASDVAGGLGAVAKVLRMMLQSAVLAVGAYLVIHQEATAGIIIAGSILTARALGAGRSRDRALEKLCRCAAELAPAEQARWQQSRPRRATASAGVRESSCRSRGGQHRAARRPAASIVQDVIVRGSKGRQRRSASLARALRANPRWRAPWSASGMPVRGKVRLDGAALDQWSPDVLGRHVGYLPQDVELFAGTVAQNIARFRGRGRSPTPSSRRRGRRRARADPRCRRLRRPRSARRGRRCRPDSGSGSRWPARSMAIPSWSCSTSRTPTSTAEGDEALTHAIARHSCPRRHRRGGRAPAVGIVAGVNRSWC